VFNAPLPCSIDEKKAFLHLFNIALWDVISSCEISGSSDSSIKNVTPNNLNIILENCNIKQIFVNGKTAEKYYSKYTEPLIGQPSICLPSTSPANATWSVDILIDEWKIISVFAQL